MFSTKKAPHRRRYSGWTYRAGEFVLAGSLDELNAKGRLVLHGSHRPILVIYDRGRVFALDNRCPHMGFPLERGSVDDGILTCHWHHARFDLESGCTKRGRACGSS
jgi:nitrite reductase/ring-hydroxylating ferredoxin subunit